MMSEFSNDPQLPALHIPGFYALFTKDQSNWAEVRVAYFRDDPEMGMSAVVAKDGEFYRADQFADFLGIFEGGYDSGPLTEMNIARIQAMEEGRQMKFDVDGVDDAPETYAYKYKELNK